VRTFRIFHCLRAPVGGLFRHVCDLAMAQAEAGHRVGLVCDSRTGGEAAAKALRRMEDAMELGIYRMKMHRQLGPYDYLTYRRIRDIVRNRIGADVLHGHGAKGGAYARLISNSLKREKRHLPAIYTPHGGSLHYSHESFRGRLYLDLEKRLAPMTGGIIFESEFAAQAYRRKVGAFPCPVRVIHNGLRPEEFYQVIVDPDAADFVYIGELRRLKGVDILLQALSRLRRTHPVRALIVGSGPDEQVFKRIAESSRLEPRVRFLPPMAAGQAFARARCLVVPSRVESLPYIVLEAAAAQMPMIATAAGGIPEITDGTDMVLAEPGSIASLRQQMAAFLEDPDWFARQARDLQARVSKRHTVAVMTQAILDLYAEVAASTPA
jgi:glycosyltransferase involved in cell wall biosynthesis